MFKNFLQAFIPIFVAVDALGVLPIFINLTEGLDQKTKSKVILVSMITAICLATAFVFLGQSIFNYLSITVGDFMIAGGIILFCIAINDIIKPGKKRRLPGNELGSVPLGTPLIVGPAVLTTILIIINECGLPATLLSILINVLIAGLIFNSSGILIRLFGESGVKVISKVVSLILAAYGIMMIRKGIQQMLPLLRG
ncbi:MAG: MarC family protein [Candidatus Schekmanbacteria bacterium]|nr:MarC family protein [Candidatus Schekmanbacteria bacterium]